MKTKDFLSLTWFGLKTIFLKMKRPILGTIILTDYCNLSCKHCSVNNINKKMYSYKAIRREIENFYREGIRILFFCGGETLLWENDGKIIRDLIKEAKEIGFYIVNIVTNGTIDLDIPEADVIFLSIDGTKEIHDAIRGDTYDKILENLNKVVDSNICVYMAINKLNYQEVEAVTKLVKEHPNINSISFNFHTPYEGTEHLSLSQEEKRETIDSIKKMIREGMPIFNLYSSLDAYIENQWERPCYQCVVSEEEKRYVCGRCVEIEGLCQECGYLFAVEFSLLFQGNAKIIFEMLKTYLRYV
ncbi:4Fe-4S single cluster domain-containing protein [Anaerovirgula multivorans]|uniref:4Fe-4S single cluster domain-containing protein n=1 Tax=Anaerovirgula multivorans TaxID=312168 RepID=A0A239FVJ8_9FIRM|nr:radical SAM protein [Anaerovirgula multivorans]SNS61196.1 4Fe-4S single cluster domain-containing protein [Anaerovirgula multivorans]